MEISFSLDFLDATVKNIISNHPPAYILFGTDSPWTDQQNSVSLLKGLQLGEEKEARIFRENAVKLLDSV
jgi:predicted TIM-barrel fold metal-dependent hydrolase